MKLMRVDFFDDKKQTEPLRTDVQFGINDRVQERGETTVAYTTTEEGSSTQFLNKKQTFGGKYDYFFTMSEMIIGRELLPSQDTPAVKFSFYLGIKVPKELRGMISGLFD